MFVEALITTGEAQGLARFFALSGRLRGCGLLAFLVIGLLAVPALVGAQETPGAFSQFEALQSRSVDAELSILEEIESTLLSAESLDALSTPEYWQRLDRIEAILSDLSTPEAEKRIRELGREHSDPNVRRMVLWVAERQLPDPEAKKLIIDLVHDPDDLVSFAGIRLTGKHKIMEGTPDLLDVVGVASGTLHSPGKPVGVGAALGNRSVFQVLGTENYHEIYRREVLWRAEGTVLTPTPSEETPLPAPYPRAEYQYFSGQWEEEQWTWYRQMRSELPPSETAVQGGPVQAEVVEDERGIPMAEVPAGEFIFGIDPSRLPSRRFVTRDYDEPEMLHLDTFWIDVFPVTNEYYDRFVQAVAEDGHEHCHPDEKPGKVHRRNTWRDPRMQPDHPVAGVDWYDAWAFCNWMGKQLPTEHQWEKAARGTDGRLYPWGDVWDPRRVTYAETVWGYGIPTIDIWRAHLYDVIDYPEPHPTILTQPVDAHPGNVSPYGVREMLGNVWEWTRTNYFTQEEMAPDFKEVQPTEYTHDPVAFVTIRGGAWSSIPELMSGPYRSKDLFTDRHNEIGFRCAKETEP